MDEAIAYYDRDIETAPLRAYMFGYIPSGNVEALQQIEEEIVAAFD